LGHIADISGPGRAALIATAFAATLALGGCGGIEFQGKVFDYMGISGDHQEPDPKLAERPPLLLPPNPKALPQPGNGVAVATAREDWPQNPELVQKQVAKAQADAKAEQVTDATDPINPLQGKSNPLLEKWLGKNNEPVPVDDVPEPDPSSDKPAEEVAQTKPKPLTPHQPQEITPTEDLFHPAPPESYKNPTSIY
jgi:hypothetical protein